MDNLLLKIVLSALLHDIGKIYERAGKELDSQFININRSLYQPYFNGHFTHKHVLYTAKFIEDYQNYIPTIFHTNENEETSLINLASKHHKPDSVYQLIISEADQLSSGYERRSFEEKPKPDSTERASDIPLFSIFEDISIEETRKDDRIENFQFAYLIDKLSPMNLFPQNKTANLASNKHYQNLLKDFEEDFKNLLFKAERPDIWLENLNALLMEYFLFVPSAIFGKDSSSNKFTKIHSDISLYDHLYLTASLAGALYLYHKNTNSLTEGEIKNREIEKFLFIEGNFYGIQKFIFSSGGETRKWAGKLLRGRSFMVSLMTELVADYIMQKISLPFVSLISSAAGKFLLLAPNIDEIKQNLSEIEGEINNWFYNNYYGETAIGITYTTACPSEFLPTEGQSKGYTYLKKRLGRASEEKKYQKFDLSKISGTYPNYFENFAGYRICKLCGKRPATKSKEFIHGKYSEIVETCSICKSHVEIGERLVKYKYLLIYRTNNKEKSDDSDILDIYKVKFINKEDIFRSDINNLVHIWDISLFDQKEQSSGNKNNLLLPKKFINAYVPKDENSGQVITLEELAKEALVKEEGVSFGIEALGIFKADVDNLGTIFYKGLRDKKRTFSRYLALSRMLNLFFAYYLPYLCKEKYKNIYNVFCGGDDLFVIGPWRECYKFALEVNDCFKKFVCNNSSFSISGGFILAKHDLPIPEFAERSESALNYAKEKGKNKLSIFGEAIPWEKIAELEEIKEYLYDQYRKGKLAKGFLYKLNQIISMVIKSEEIIKNLNNKNEIWNKLDNLLWPSKLYYFTIRNYDKSKILSKEKRESEMTDFIIKLNTWLEKHKGDLKLPLWQILYSTRRVRDGGD